MTELKPCPFCGGEVNVHSSSDAFSSPFLEIYCPQCYTSMRWYINVLESDEHNEEGIIQRWNTRTSDWHTGTPSEGGWYLMKVKLDDEIIYDTNYLTPCVYGMDWRYAHEEIIEWQKIEEKEDGHAD